MYYDGVEDRRLPEVVMTTGTDFETLRGLLWRLLAVYDSKDR